MIIKNCAYSLKVKVNTQGQIPRNVDFSGHFKDNLCQLQLNCPWTSERFRGNIANMQHPCPPTSEGCQGDVGNTQHPSVRRSVGPSFSHKYCPASCAAPIDASLFCLHMLTHGGQ